MPYYEWTAKTDHRVAYTEIAPYLREAVATVEAAGIAATIRYAPQCTIKGMERNHVGIVGVRHDIHEWMNAIDHKADPVVPPGMGVSRCGALGFRALAASGGPLPRARSPLRDIGTVQHPIARVRLQWTVSSDPRLR